MEFEVDDSRLQEVLDRAWKAFGDPNAPPFPSQEQVEEGKRIFESWKATQQLKAQRKAQKARRKR